MVATKEVIAEVQGATESLVWLKLKDLNRELIQTREKLNDEAISDYAEKIRKGVTFPPGKVFEIDGRKVLVGGFHRYRAFERARLDSMPCVVRQGTEWEALVEAI